MTARSIEARRFWDRIPVRPRIHWHVLGDALRHVGADVLLSLAILFGWTSLTLGIAALAGAHARAVYFLSAGLFLLSLAGWRLLWTLAADGLYLLTRKKPRA